VEAAIVPAIIEDSVEEKVLDVLDYLLECNELDEPTHRRLSKQSFSRTEIKRLSISAPITNKRVSFILPSGHNSLSCTPEKASTTVPAQEQVVEETVVMDYTEDALTSEEVECDIGEIDTLYAPVSEECEIGDMDVLFALRNYIATLDPTPVKKTPLKEQQPKQSSEESSENMDEQVDEPVENQELPVTDGSEDSQESEEDNTPSETTTESSEEAAQDSAEESSAGSEKSSGSQDSIASDVTVMEPTSEHHTVSTEEEDDQIPSYVSLDSVALNLSGRKSMFRRRMSVDEGEPELENPCASPVTAVPSSAMKTISEESESTIVAPVTVPQIATRNNANTVITYPRTEAIQYALSHQMVTVKVIGFIETSDHHIQYMVDVVIPSALTDEGNIVPSMRMFLLKRFSEFKEFRQDLCSTILPEQFLEWQYAGECMESIPPLKTRHSSLCNK
jgi:hypothetical protein